MRKLILAISAILVLSVSFTTAPKVKEKEAAKAKCEICWVKCGVSYIDVEEDWWFPKICQNYVSLFQSRCSLHGGITCNEGGGAPPAQP